MMNIEPDASHTPDVLRDVLEEIETLRNIRQEEVRDRPHPFLKRFTQQEVTDEACPTYKNLLVGRSQRIPIIDGFTTHFASEPNNAKEKP